MSLNSLLSQMMEIWQGGGWAMYALAANGFILFAIGIHLWVRFRGRGLKSVPDRRLRQWIASPETRKGRVGRLIEFVMGAENADDMSVRFNEVHSTELAPFARNLKFMRRAVSTAPLLGLLGTVTGMLTTFQALATGSGGDKTMEMVAGGISEALITTETGLVIALPGLFFQYHLARQRDKYDTFLARMETACAQFLYRSGRLASNLPTQAPAASPEEA